MSSESFVNYETYAYRLMFAMVKELKAAMRAYAGDVVAFGLGLFCLPAEDFYFYATFGFLWAFVLAIDDVLAF